MSYGGCRRFYILVAPIFIDLFSVKYALKIAFALSKWLYSCVKQQLLVQYSDTKYDITMP